MPRRLGPAEPLTAISEEYDNARYDEVIVSTLADPAGHGGPAAPASASLAPTASAKPTKKTKPRPRPRPRRPTAPAALGQ